MKVTILNNIYDMPDQESWNLKIDNRLANFTTWNDGRTWLNYYKKLDNVRPYELSTQITEYCNAKIYLPLDRTHPAKTISTFYKLLMLQ